MPSLRFTRSVWILLLPLILGPGSARATDAPDPVRAAGHWEGEIDLPQNAGKIQVMIDLVRNGGAWTGTVDIPMQNAKELPLEDIALDAGKVHFRIKGVPGAPTFDGTLASGPPQAIQGTFMQNGTSLPFRLGREPVAKPVRPQEPKPPFPYTAEEVTYANGDVKLAGTLTIPPGDGPFPAVVMITGSGAQDRDETVLGHKPFLILADHLSRNGIAVLRADDRGVGRSTGSVPSSTTADFAQDVLAGVGFLKTHPKIAKDRIGLIGHSEGGVVAPLAANQSSDVAFIVLLAGPGVPGSDVLLLQVERMSRADGSPEERVQKQLTVIRRMIDVLREQDSAVREAKLREAAREDAATMTPDALKAAGGIDGVIDRDVRFFGSSWFRYFLTYDPRPALRKVKVPVLALNGELDLQVIPDQNLPEIEKALKEAGNRDVTLKRLPGINHALQPGAKTGSPEEYAKSEITVAPAVLDTVTQWITARFVTPQPAQK